MEWDFGIKTQRQRKNFSYKKMDYLYRFARILSDKRLVYRIYQRIYYGHIQQMKVPRLSKYWKGKEEDLFTVQFLTHQLPCFRTHRIRK